jgi:hypothetical protein
MLNKLKGWISKAIHATQVNPLWRLFLFGVKGQIENRTPKPYNFYFKIISVGSSILCAYYILLFHKNEMDVVGYNILIPTYIYKVREESHIYW